MNIRSKAETILREEVKEQMAGLWAMTWHENGGISPGVPDLSYVMHGGQFETGWLELKAVFVTQSRKWHLEPSQHEWFRKYPNTPIHVLCAWGETCWVFNANQHDKLTSVDAVTEAIRTSVRPEGFSIHKLRTYLPPVLRQATQRGLNGIPGI